MDKKYAQYLLKKTTANYNLIAKDYTRTRPFFLEDVKSLGKYVQAGEKVLDSGCANGRLFDVLKIKDIEYFGVDISKNLIEIAKKKYPEAKFQVADVLSLPFSNNYFDKIYSISVIHNIPSKEFQLQYLKEARRILKPKGLLIMRVSDFWRKRAFPRLLFKYTLFKLIGKSKLDFKDVYVPWKDFKKRTLAQRYFHCFTKK